MIKYYWDVVFKHCVILKETGVVTFEVSNRMKYEHDYDYKSEHKKIYKGKRKPFEEFRKLTQIEIVYYGLDNE